MLVGQSRAIVGSLLMSPAAQGSTPTPLSLHGTSPLWSLTAPAGGKHALKSADESCVSRK